MTAAKEYTLMGLVLVFLIAMMITAGLHIYNEVMSNLSAEGVKTEQEDLEIIEGEDHEFGEVFESDGLLCAHFVARNYDLRKELGITCLHRGNFLTIAPVLMHPDNHRELVAVQSKVRREAITRAGW